MIYLLLVPVFLLLFPFSVLPFRPLISTKTWAFSIIFLSFKERFSTKQWLFHKHSIPFSGNWGYPDLPESRRFKHMYMITIFGVSLSVMRFYA